MASPRTLIPLFDKYPYENWTPHVFLRYESGDVEEIPQAEWGDLGIAVVLDNEGALTLTAPSRGGSGGGWTLGLELTGGSAGYVTEGIVFEAIVAGDTESSEEGRAASVGLSFSGGCEAADIENGTTVDFEAICPAANVDHMRLSYWHGGS